MAGTKIGGQKAAATNLARNPNFYEEIGAKGGSATGIKGFAIPIPCNCGKYGFKAPHVIANCAGSRGGRRSSRRATIKEAAN